MTLRKKLHSSSDQSSVYRNDSIAGEVKCVIKSEGLGDAGSISIKETGEAKGKKEKPSEEGGKDVKNTPLGDENTVEVGGKKPNTDTSEEGPEVKETSVKSGLRGNDYMEDEKKEEPGERKRVSDGENDMDKVKGAVKTEEEKREDEKPKSGVDTTEAREEFERAATKTQAEILKEGEGATVSEISSPNILTSEDDKESAEPVAKQK